jgi:hypothetical protein
VIWLSEFDCLHLEIKCSHAKNLFDLRMGDFSGSIILHNLNQRELISEIKVNLNLLKINNGIQRKIEEKKKSDL